MSPTTVASVNIQIIPLTAKYPRLHAYWENPTDWPSVGYAASRFDSILFWEATKALAASVKAIRPTIKTGLYTLPLFTINDGSQPWSGDLATAAAESWYLHNPEGDLTTGTRVRRDLGAGIIETVMDVRNQLYRDWIKVRLAQQAQAVAGIDGLYFDGSIFLTGIPADIGLWVVQPTVAQQNGWWGWALAFTDNLRTYFQSVGLNYLQLNSVTDYKAGNPDFVDDTLPPGPPWTHCDVTHAEFRWHSYLDNAAVDGNQNDWDWWRTRTNSSMSAVHDLINLSGVNDTRSPGEHRWAIYALANHLLFTNGLNLYQSWHLTTAEVDYMFNINAGRPTQSVVANADGTWQRQYTLKLVKVNPQAFTAGGLSAFTASIA